jgi:hypothetical protein
MKKKTIGQAWEIYVRAAAEAKAAAEVKAKAAAAVRVEQVAWCMARIVKNRR